MAIKYGSQCPRTAGADRFQIPDSALSAGESGECTLDLWSPVSRGIAARQVVHDAVAKRQGQDRKGCLTAGARSADENVQLFGIQRCGGRSGAAPR